MGTYHEGCMYRPGSSYDPSGQEAFLARQAGAIAVLYDFLNGEDTTTFFYSEDEVAKAEQQYVNSEQYSVERI